jgi:hypothetical protein
VASSLGALKVEGTKGPGQNPAVDLYRCQIKNGEPVKGSCALAKKGLVNVVMKSLVPGSYLVVSGSSIAAGLTEVRANETTTVKLGTLEFTPGRDIYSYQVFSDLTNAEMQNRLLRFVWGTTDASAILALCRTTEPKNREAKDFCEAWRGDDPSLLRNAMVAFLGEGWFKIVDRVTTELRLRYETPRVLTIEYMLVHFSGIGRLIAATPESGDVIGVFPGVYGVMLRLAHDQQTLLGVRVW